MPLGEFLESLEDAGVSATLSALRSCGVMRDDNERDIMVFRDREVSPEMFRRELDRHLGRHSGPAHHPR